MHYSRLNWKLTLFEGILLALLGAIALIFPFIASISFNIFLGAILIATGVIEGFRALTTLKDPHSVSLLIGAGLAFIAGLLLFRFPMVGVITLALLLTIYFFVDGIAKVMDGWHYRPLKGSWWIIFTGVLSILLAILIIAGFPTTAIWVFGIYLGIYLLFLGSSLIALSCELKKTPVSERGGTTDEDRW